VQKVEHLILLLLLETCTRKSGSTHHIYRGKTHVAEVNPEDTITTVKLNIVVNAAEVRLKENTPALSVVVVPVKIFEAD